MGNDIKRCCHGVPLYRWCRECCCGIGCPHEPVEPAPPPASLGDEEKPNLYTLRQGVPSEMLSKIQAWARAESCEWPHGTYSPNDFPAFFEKGALWGLRTSQASLSEALKRGEEEIARLRDDCQHLKMLRDWDRAVLKRIADANTIVGKVRRFTLQDCVAFAREALGDGEGKE